MNESIIKSTFCPDSDLFPLTLILILFQLNKCKPWKTRVCWWDSDMSMTVILSLTTALDQPERPFDSPSGLWRELCWLGCPHVPGQCLAETAPSMADSHDADVPVHTHESHQGPRWTDLLFTHRNTTNNTKAFWSFISKPFWSIMFYLFMITDSDTVSALIQKLIWVINKTISLFVFRVLNLFML